MSQRVTQVAKEVLYQGGSLRSTQVSKEVLYQGGSLRSTQISTEVLRSTRLASIDVTLVDAIKNPFTNLTNLSWHWFDEDTLDALTTPTDQKTGATTDTNGVLNVELFNTSLSNNENGTLIVQTDDGLRLAFAKIQRP